ncbi:MAG: hypothetical protein M0042_08575, partial [Nitrospiraceae bacterium]|nr:hypothetical protein [Nitrospiraceae bacterium]
MSERGMKFLLFLVLISCLSLPSFTAANPGEQPADEAAACLSCHGHRGMTLSFQNGETTQAFVDPAKFRSSLHRDLSCTSCHTEFSEQQHPKRTFKNREQYAAAASGVCRQCHPSEQLKKTAIHASLLSSEKHLPVCSTCHNPHAVTSMAREKASLSENDHCLGCHRHDMKITLKNRESVSLKVDETALQGSVHAKLSCFDCHFGFSSSQHPKRNFTSPRDFSISQSEACRRCHFDKYTKTLESIHYALLSHGDLRAPVCTDCHGAHSVAQARVDKLRSSKRCGRCHVDIFGTYSKSVHGSALVQENNFDVPICADCHTAHTIQSAHSQDYRDKVPEICGKCHGDAALMKKYGLYAGVVNSYLQDFHGVTLRLRQIQKNGGSNTVHRAIATCVDCHGVH